METNYYRYQQDGNDSALCRFRRGASLPSAQHISYFQRYFVLLFYFRLFTERTKGMGPEKNIFLKFQQLFSMSLFAMLC